MVLLNSSGVLEKMKEEMRKVYLYSRFAPCPDCAAQLATYPRTYPRTKFSLAYFDPLPATADDKEKKKWTPQIGGDLASPTTAYEAQAIQRFLDDAMDI